MSILYDRQSNTASTSEYSEQKKHTELKARRLVMERLYGLESTSTGIDTKEVESETDTLFEFDIVGARVANVGQRTGGFMREVEENESALSFVFQDKVALYLLDEVNRNERAMDINALMEIICSGAGALRIIKLVQGGLLDIVGNTIQITERGIYILESISRFTSELRNESI